MGITDGCMQYGGWTLDNVLILGAPLAVAPGQAIEGSGNNIEY
jgi:hypothetical protein